MRSFWDRKARENPMWFIHSALDYDQPDVDEFCHSGTRALHETLNPFGRSIGPADRVLEIGCGIGRITRAIALQAGSVVGLDVSPEMLLRAQAELADLPHVTFFQGTGDGLDGLADGDFDVVYSFIVFQHIP